MSFSEWFEDAEIPVKRKDGEWEDRGCGGIYIAKTKANRKPLSDKIKEARAVAKDFGGKALKGSKKQKDWAEGIRANILKNIDKNLAETLASNALFQHSSVFINIRNKSHSNIEQMLIEILELIKEHNNHIFTAEKIDNNSRVVSNEAGKLYEEAEKIKTKIHALLN